MGEETRHPFADVWTDKVKADSRLASGMLRSRRSYPNSSILVTGEALLLELGTAMLSVAMSQEQITEIPNPRSDLTLPLQTTPGTVMNTDVQGGKLLDTCSAGLTTEFVSAAVSNYNGMVISRPHQESD